MDSTRVPQFGQTSLSLSSSEALTSPEHNTGHFRALRASSIRARAAGDLVRFYVVDAGPSLTTAFHVVGTIFDRVYPNGDMNPAHSQSGVQTVDVPAGGGAVFEVKIDEPGLYPFVSHAFAHVDLGQVGVLKVGNPKGSMGH